MPRSCNSRIWAEHEYPHTLCPVLVARQQVHNGRKYTKNQGGNPQAHTRASSRPVRRR